VGYGPKLRLKKGRKGGVGLPGDLPLANSKPIIHKMLLSSIFAPQASYNTGVRIVVTCQILNAGYLVFHAPLASLFKVLPVYRKLPDS
jgi:hypothetical protein